MASPDLKANDIKKFHYIYHLGFCLSSSLIKRILAVTSLKAIAMIINSSATFCPIAGSLTASCATSKIHWTGKHNKFASKLMTIINYYKFYDKVFDLMVNY